MPGLVEVRSASATSAYASAPPSCQAISPHSVRIPGRPSRRLRAAGLDLVADHRHPPDPPGHLVEAAAGQQFLHLLGKLVQPGAGQQMPQGQHRVGLAATEVGLQVDDRGGVLVPADPLHRPGQQIPQPVGQVGAAEELHRVAVLVIGLPGGHGVQVRGELRGVESPGLHIRVRSQDLPPWFQAVHRHRRDGRRTAHRADDLPVLLVCGQPPQVHPNPANLVGLLSSTRGA